MQKKELNIRDFASINELVVMSNLENTNAVLISQKADKADRFKQLTILAKTQLETLDGKDFIKSLKKLSETTYLDIDKRNKS